MSRYAVPSAAARCGSLPLCSGNCRVLVRTLRGLLGQRIDEHDCDKITRPSNSKCPLQGSVRSLR